MLECGGCEGRSTAPLDSWSVRCDELISDHLPPPSARLQTCNTTSLSAVAHSYEGADAANLLKGRSHIGDLHVGGNTDRLTDLTLKANKFCDQQLATTAA